MKREKKVERPQKRDIIYLLWTWDESVDRVMVAWHHGMTVDLQTFYV